MARTCIVPSYQAKIRYCRHNLIMKLRGHALLLGLLNWLAPATEQRSLDDSNASVIRILGLREEERLATVGSTSSGIFSVYVNPFTLGLFLFALGRESGSDTAWSGIRCDSAEDVMYVLAS